ncbi:GVQW3 [Cordylochernes scorpioides]|uniref:GVQW3 n=1 Tax=Cordylochernes scorpioides TaxID=51811 RepID=A0ABY6LBH1_9ARAC|nr:GVQW3 [Cordylochernes scorpioides]
MDRKFEQRICIKFCYKIGKSASETLDLLKLAFGNENVNKPTTFRWFSRFKNGMESVKDEKRVGRPILHRNPEKGPYGSRVDAARLNRVLIPSTLRKRQPLMDPQIPLLGKPCHPSPCRGSPIVICAIHLRASLIRLTSMVKDGAPAHYSNIIRPFQNEKNSLTNEWDAVDPLIGLRCHLIIHRQIFLRSAGQKPGRPSILTPTGSENSAKNEFHGEIYGEKSNSREYVNPPADGGNVNLAAARVDVTSGMAAASSSNGAAHTIRNWADCDEVMNPGTDDDFTVVKNKKRRRESSNSPTAATPSSNSGGARSGRRVQSSARSVPRAQEIPTTRAHIAEARARQTSSAEEHCVYLEHGPELQPFHYLRALDRLLGGTAGVVQVSKVNGHQLLGLANRGLAERLINNGLEVEGTLLRAFPFRKRAERITVGNLPFFVEDSAIIKALGPYGRITSIAPKMMKAGPYTYTDGRREAFIVLHEGVTTERLPTRLNITIKGEAWPAYLSSGIKCSRCHGQGHRRANCPLLAGRVNTTRSAPPASPAGLPPTTTPAPPQRPTPQHSAPAPPLEISGASPAPRAAIHPAGAPRPSPTAPSASPTEETPPAPPPVTPDPSSQAPSDPASQEILGPANIAQDIEMTAVEESIPPSASSNKKCTRIDLAAFIKRSPSVSFAGTDALGLGRKEVLDLLSSRTKAHKRGRHLTPPQSNALAGLVNQILDLRPGGDSNSTIYKVLRQVLSELRSGTAAVPPAPTLPAPRPAEPAPPAPQKRESTPAMATPPPPPSTQMEVDSIDKRCKELQLLTFELMKEFNPKPMPQLISFELDLVEAVLYPEDRKDFLGRFSPGDKKVLAQILDKLSTRDLDSLTLRGLSELRAALPS